MKNSWLKAISVLINTERPERSKFYANGDLLWEGPEAGMKFARVYNALKASGNIAASSILFAEEGFSSWDAEELSSTSLVKRFLMGEETPMEEVSTVNEWLVK